MMRGGAPGISVHGLKSAATIRVHPVWLSTGVIARGATAGAWQIPGAGNRSLFVPLVSRSL